MMKQFITIFLSLSLHETQDVAKAYQAACTRFYVFDEIYFAFIVDASMTHHGQSTSVTGKDLQQALDNILSGKAVNPEQKQECGL